jgi:hypothetical protein
MTLTKQEMRTLAGFRRAFRNPASRGWNIVYRAERAGIDAGGCRWAVVCEMHGSTQACPNLELAWLAGRHPQAWCDRCVSAS